MTGSTTSAIGDRVFGSAASAAAELAVLSQFAAIPESLDFTSAAALPVAVETATRCLDLLGVAEGQTVLNQRRLGRGRAGGGAARARRAARG